MTILIEDKQILDIQGFISNNPNTAIRLSKNKEGLDEREFIDIEFSEQELEKIKEFQVLSTWNLIESSVNYWTIPDPEALKLTMSLILVNKGIL